MYGLSCRNRCFHWAIRSGAVRKSLMAVPFVDYIGARSGWPISGHFQFKLTSNAHERRHVLAKGHLLQYP